MACHPMSGFIEFGEASMAHARETSDNRMNALYE